MKDWRERLRELGFGNQAVIVGVRRRELFDEIATLLSEERQRVIEKIKKMPFRDQEWGSKYIDRDDLLAQLEKEGT